jgi:predicted Zn-dependent protease
MSGSTTSIEQMIATCERGIYVNRLSGVMVADRPSGTMSGVTRDGCFLIKNGKIDKPVINFRIYQSPVLSFNNVLAMGEPKRVSFGFSPPPGGAGGRFDEALGAWPKPPVIAPPMMVHDFNFSALADAI